MSFITLRNGRRIGDYLKPYIVAELNTSHFGNIEIAKSMIDQAKTAGCDCVKFQSWSADTLYSESYYEENKMAKRIVSKFSLSDAQLHELAEYATKKEVDFASTPYSIEEARFLVEKCNVPFIKIASMELNNTPYLNELGRLEVPLVLSTGMGTTEEIISAVEVIRSTGNENIVILHCTSVYPSPPSIIRLKNILGLRTEFPQYPIGYSDHSLGIEIPAASIALGACLIEKHFTLDSSRIGMDNQMATEPEEMRAMVLACNRVHESLGGTARLLSTMEEEQITKMRRSMIAKNKLPNGSSLKLNDVEFKRPGTGISPQHTHRYLNKIITRDIEAGEIIQPKDLI
jgi:N-acetylneuraminate synthase